MTKNNIRYNFKQADWFDYIMLPSIFAPLYWFNGYKFAFTLIIDLSLAWIFGTFNFRFLRITQQHIIGVRFLKPFQKIYRYNYTDLTAVDLIYYSKGGWKAHFKFNDGIRFSGEINYDKKTLCSFFLDNNIPVNSNNQDLINFITYYKRNPETDRRGQIQLRKAREFAR